LADGRTMAICVNLVDLLKQTATQAVEGGVGYLSEDGSCRWQSYAELLAKATARMASLRERGLLPGSTLILAPGNNESFIVTFWACLLGGVVPVPLAPPPSSSKLDATVAKLQSVWETLGRPRILLRQLPPVDWGFPADDVLVEPDLAVPDSTPDLAAPLSDDPAFIQFSSGSTAQPKGVVLSNRNVLANLRAIAEGLVSRAEDRSVNWMPLHHDMGLVGFHLAGLHAGVKQFHLEAAAFVRHPLLWLDVLSQYRATITAAPNFSQSLVLARLENARSRSWDLSSVRLVMNGAEPISVHLMQRFLAALAPYGLREQAMFPCYGLAEAALAVCFPPLDEPPRIETLDRAALQASGRAVPAASPRTAIRFVSEGFPVRDCQVRVVNGEDRTVPEDVVGHIQIRGENVTRGYYGAPPESAGYFSGDGWLRTGDLGFLRDGRLCVTGRVKDMLIVAGQNLYAHDIEQAAQQVEGVTAGRVAACGCYDPAEEREKLVLFIATPNAERDAAKFRDVRRRIQSVIGVRPDALVPLSASAFPKTTSGKLQRFLLRERFERGEFEQIAWQMEEWIAALPPDPQRQMPRTATETLLQRAWCETLGLPEAEVGIHDRFADFGGRSIHAAIVIARIESHFGVTVHSEVLASLPTIAGIAEYIDRSAGTAKGARRYFRG
jgi:acyl-CoA synthetase (AMP-forming)/AMP-acid ligase II/acyl carrier protein